VITQKEKRIALYVLFIEWLVLLYFITPLALGMIVVVITAISIAVIFKD